MNGESVDAPQKVGSSALNANTGRLRLLDSPTRCSGAVAVGGVKEFGMRGDGVVKVNSKSSARKGVGVVKAAGVDSGAGVETSTAEGAV